MGTSASAPMLRWFQSSGSSEDVITRSHTASGHVDGSDNASVLALLGSALNGGVEAIGPIAPA